MSQLISAPRVRSHPAHIRLALGGFLLASFLPEVAGVVSTLPPFSSWYVRAPRLGWSPPVWVYQTTWPIVYGALGVAGWLVWQRLPRRQPAFALYVTQSVLQVLWTIAFLALGAVRGDGLWAVFALLVVLDLALTASAITSWPVSRVASLLMWFAAAWILFGTALSFGDTLMITLSRST